MLIPSLSYFLVHLKHLLEMSFKLLCLRVLFHAKRRTTEVARRCEGHHRPHLWLLDLSERVEDTLPLLGERLRGCPLLRGRC